MFRLVNGGKKEKFGSPENQVNRNFTVWMGQERFEKIAVQVVDLKPIEVNLLEKKQHEILIGQLKLLWHFATRICSISQQVKTQ